MTSLLDDRADAASAPSSPDPAPAPVARRPAATVTLGLVLVTLGVISLLVTLDVDVPVRIIGPTLLIVLGLGVAVSAVRGEPDGGLVALTVLVGLVLSVGAIGSAVLDVPLRGGVGDREYAPTSTEQLDDEYRLFAGSLELDLRDLELGPGTTSIELSTVLGQVDVRLPGDVEVAVDSGVGAGTAVVLGSTVDGLSVDNDRRTEGYEAADRRLDLHVRVGLGEIRIAR